MRVLLIAGGWSPEREVSLSGSAAVAEALAGLGHEAVAFDPKKSFDGLAGEARECDFAFICLHGSPGEDGLIQALLDAAGCPYQGSGPAGSFLALHKAAAKQVLSRAGLATPEWLFLPSRPRPGWLPDLPLPLFVKPNLGGSSLGMSLILEQRDIGPALDRVFSLGDTALLERHVKGLELTCPVLGPHMEEEALPVVQIRPRGAAFFDYDAKYRPGASEELCPAPISADLEARVREAALTAHRALGLSGYSRADFIVPEDGLPRILEVNTLPGMTPTSLLPLSARVHGLSFQDLIARLIELGQAGRRCCHG
jgi:D-alanine-D-alanine ligase